jgi:hypothetical protein
VETLERKIWKVEMVDARDYEVKTDGIHGEGWESSSELGILSSWDAFQRRDERYHGV